MAKHYRIAVTGHRNLVNESTAQFVRRCFITILTRAKQEHPEGVIALSGLAEGTDSLFAEIALQLSIPVEAVIAYKNFFNDFAPGPARKRYRHLLLQCQAVHQLPYRQRSDEAYLAAGNWLVNHSDLLVAAWNGQPAEGKGGTGDVVYYALQRQRPIEHIHTTEFIIEHLKPTIR